MVRFVTKDKLSKKAQKELNRQRRITWDFSPVTKTVGSKKLYNRKRNARDRYDDYGTSVFHLVLQILSFVAESERNNIKKRQAEGIAAARARGVHLGRPVKDAPENFPEIVKAWEKGEITLAEALKRSNMGQTSFYRRRREYNLVHPVKKQTSEQQGDN